MSAEGIMVHPTSASGPLLLPVSTTLASFLPNVSHRATPDTTTDFHIMDLMKSSMGNQPRPDSENIPFDPTSRPPQFGESNLIITIVLSLLFLLSLLGNVTTIVQMSKQRNKHSTIYTLILQLATADLIVTFFVIAAEAIWQGTVQWYAGNFMCKFIKYAEVFGLYLSTYITVIISIDRCCAILDPMSKNRAASRVKMMIIVAWVLSAIFSTPQAFMFSSQRGPWQEDFYQCVNFNFYTAYWQEKVYLFASLFLMFIIPLVIMVTCYSLIFITISRKSRDIESEHTSTEDMLHGKVRSQLLHKAKTKSLKMTAIIVAVFCVCWCPYYVMFGVHTYVREEDLSSILPWLFASGMLVSVINPIIYGAFHMCRPRSNRRHHSATPFVRGKFTANNSRLSTKSTLTSRHVVDRNGARHRNGAHAGPIMYVGNGNPSTAMKTTPLLHCTPRVESPVEMDGRRGMLVTYMITDT